MPAEGEVDALFQREIQEAEDPAEYRRMAIERLHALKSPWKKAESFEMADVIHPAETRWYVGRFIQASWGRIQAKLGPPRRWPIV
jgi:acetyl-CoA carboxylase carboxyltransferase component